MKKEGADLLSIIINSWPAVLVALFGGFVEIMLSGQKIKVKFALGSMAAAGFVGLLICLLLHEANFPEGLKGFLVGVCGASARSSLALLQRKGQDMLQRLVK